MHTTSISHDDYHAESGRPFVTSHLLSLFAKSPRHYRDTVDCKIPRTESPAMLFGRAAHTLLLEGDDEFRAQYDPAGPINEKTGRPYGATTKKSREHASKTGLTIIDPDDYAHMILMRESVLSHPLAGPLLETGDIELTVRNNLLDLPCQARIDFLSRNDCIVDIKTCFDIDVFPEDFRKYRYANQLAFYRDLWMIDTQQDLKVRIIAIEKTPPYRCGVYAIAAGILVRASSENARSMAELSTCMKENCWPTRYEVLRTIV